MFSRDEYTLTKDYKLNREPVLAAKAEQHRVLEEAGLIQRMKLSCEIKRWLWRFGQVLMNAGQRLEGRFEPANLPCGGQGATAQSPVQ